MPSSALTPAKSGAEALVNTYTGNRQESSSVTALDNGGYVVTWQSLNQPGDNGWGVYAQRFNADGSTAGSEIHVNTTLGDHQAGATVVAGAGGAFTILWTSFQGGTNDVMAQRFDASGARLGGEFAIAASTTLNEQGVNAVALADGSFVVSYGLYDASGRTEMAQHFDASWNALGSAFAISRTFTLDGGSAVHTLDPAALAALGNGNLVSVWTQAMPGDTSTDIWAEIVTASGSLVGSAFRVNTVVAQAQGQPAVAALANGTFVVTYYSGDAGGTVFQRFAADGTKLGSEVRVDNTPNGAVDPSIMALAEGGFVIAWTGGADGDGSAVSAQRFAADGSALGDNFLLDTQITAYQTQAALAQLANGKLVATWSSEAYGDATDIAMQQFSVPAVLPAAGPNRDVLVMAANATFVDSAFSASANLTLVNNFGSGDLSYSFGANAEAAFSGAYVRARSGLYADSFTVDATGLSANATGHFVADHGVAHFTGGVETDIFQFNQATWDLAGRTADGGGGTNRIHLTYTGTEEDTDFVGISHINELRFVGTCAATVVLADNAVAAFGANAVRVVAKSGAVINVDGHGLTAGFTAIGSDGNDTFVGSAGNDFLQGANGADLFVVGQGGYDRILDFAHGVDHIDLSAAGVHALAGIRMREVGTDAVLSFAGQDLRLKGVDYHSLTASDFIFA